MVRKILLLLILFTACSIQSHNKQEVYSGILIKNTNWKGEIVIEKDLLIPENVEVVIEPGTKIYFELADSSRTEPIFLLPENEIFVKGHLIAKGTKNKPIVFSSFSKNPSQKDWGGIVLNGGSLTLKNVHFKNASSGIIAIDGSVEISDSIFSENYNSLIILKGAKGYIKNTEVLNGKTGIVIDNENITINNIKIKNNEEGMVIKKISNDTNYIEITKNETGLIIPSNLISFFIRENKVYENKRNVFFFFNDIPTH